MTLNPTSSKGSGGGSGTVTSVSSANTAIGVASPTAAVVLTLATLDVIAADGPPAADWSNNSHKITSVLDPTLAQDAATKAYVDAAITGVTWKAACAWATAAALPANVYANGASGVGATLTASANGALTIDGNTPTVLDRVLVKNEVAGANNGIYVVTTVGTAGTKYVLTRATDFDQAAEITAGDTVPVVGGTANADTSWMMTTTGAIVVGTTALVFAQFSGVVSVTATDASIVVGGTKSAPTVATGTLDVIATQHPAAAAWSNNSKKITGIATATTAGDALPYGQAAAGDLRGTYPSPLASITPAVPAGSVETIPRSAIQNFSALLAAGFLYGWYIELEAKAYTTVTTHINNSPATCANSFWGIYDTSASPVLLASSADVSATFNGTVGAALATFTLNYTPGAPGGFYICLLIGSAGTLPNFARSWSLGAGLPFAAPAVTLRTNSGGLTALPNPAVLAAAPSTVQNWVRYG